MAYVISDVCSLRLLNRLAFLFHTLGSIGSQCILSRGVRNTSASCGFEGGNRLMKDFLKPAPTFQLTPQSLHSGPLLHTLITVTAGSLEPNKR